MQIHPGLRTRLVEIAAKALSQMRVNKGMFLQAESADLLAAGDRALDARLKKHLGGTISDHPFSGFVVGYLHDHLTKAFTFQNVEPTALIGLEGFEDSLAVAERLVEAFISLPWHYTFIYPLPLKASYLGLSRPLLKFSGGSVDILRDVLY